MKIAHCHRHIAKSEYQPCIAVQTHDTSLFPPKDTTGNTDSLLFLKIVLQRPVHQLDIVRHGFIQINKFLHLTLRNYLIVYKSSPFNIELMNRPLEDYFQKSNDPCCYRWCLRGKRDVSCVCTAILGWYLLLGI